LAALCVEPLATQSEKSPCWLAEYLRARYEYSGGQLKQSQARFRALIETAQTVKPGPYLWAAPYADVYIMMSDFYRGQVKSATDLTIGRAKENLASDKLATDTIWASDLNTVSRLLVANGELHRARNAANTSFNLRKRQYGNAPLWNYSQQRQLGIAEGALGNIAEAEKLFSEAIASSEKRFSEPNYDSGLTREAWGLMLLNEGRLLEAKPLLERARQVQLAINANENCWLARIDVALAAINGLLGAKAESRHALDQLIQAADAREDIFTARRARYWRARLSDNTTEIQALLTHMLNAEKDAPPERTALAVDARLLLAENTIDKNAQWLHLEKMATEAARIWGSNNRYAESALQRAINLRPDAKAALRDAFEHTAKQDQRDELGIIVDAINARTAVITKK
jgi:tetratricopeptide (TPR) repeat protein